MDVRAYLIAQGNDEATASEIAANPKYAAIYEKAAAEAENGKTALLKAQEVEKSLKSWNETQVVPYVQKADATVAAERAKNAAMRTHMQSLKDAGYEIPAAYLDETTSTTTTTPVKVETTPVKNDEMLNYAKANMALIAMSNKYRKLTGDELDPEAEYTDFSTNARPNENLRNYIDRKYDLGAKEAAVSAQKKADYEKGLVDAGVATAKAEWAKSHGSNGETRLPESSRFAKIAEERAAGGAENGKLWQTKAGREQATQQRLEKYNGRVN